MRIIMDKMECKAIYKLEVMAKALMKMAFQQAQVQV